MTQRMKMGDRGPTTGDAEGLLGRKIFTTTTTSTTTWPAPITKLGLINWLTDLKGRLVGEGFPDSNESRGELAMVHMWAGGDRSLMGG